MYQQITIVGNLGREPEMRYTQTGVPVCSFSVAVNRQWTKDDGQREEKVTWFRITCWRKLAELAAQFLTAGSQVLITGEIEAPRAYLDAKSGEPRASLDVTANTIRFLGSPKGNGQHAAPPAGDAPAAPAAAQDAEDIPF